MIFGIVVTQFTVLRLGDSSAGSTVLVRRANELSDLAIFYDTDREACKRKGASRGMERTFCEGRLAVVIMDRGLAWARWNVSGR